MTDKTTDTTGAGAAGAAAPKPPTPPKAPRPQPQAQARPPRRVGSVTLGLCLIAVGACFLCYYFLPGFDWLPVVKVGAPLALVALGAEVLVCAARPGRWKYDFLAVVGCLAIMGGAFCLTLLPLFWQNFSPERRIRTEALKEEYSQALYEALEDTGVRLFSVHTYVHTEYGAQPTTLAELNQPGVFLSLNLELYGPYDRPADFADDCAALRDAVRQVAAEWGPLPEKIEFQWENREETVRMSISLQDRAQMGWTAEQMEEQVYLWLDDDSVETCPAEPGDALTPAEGGAGSGIMIPEDALTPAEGSASSGVSPDEADPDEG